LFSRQLMKNSFWAHCFKRGMLIVGSISLTLLSVANWQTSYKLTQMKPDRCGSAKGGGS
jgi:hypothetical protein